MNDGTDINTSSEKLRKYIEAEKFKGYDPYDTLLSPFPFRKFTNWSAVIATQLQKRNPFNIRRLLGIKKEFNPKAIGILLEAYIDLQKKNSAEDFSEQINFLFNNLKENYSKGYSGYCWGYNFPWSTTEKYLEAFAPNVVTTAFAARGIFKYYEFSKDENAKKILLSIGDFITRDLQRNSFAEGITFSYTPFFSDVCYNASMLAAETLSLIYGINKNEEYRTLAIAAVNAVVVRQHSDGHWNYSLDISKNIERVQIDFHQGYILSSIIRVMNFLDYKPEEWIRSLKSGAEFYRTEQFFPDGRSKWRLPREYPIEIHNQSQGIITFSECSFLDESYLHFAHTIARWTIKNMQDEKGFFYYRKLKMYMNKISYMRWSNAWMFLALTRLKVIGY